MNDILEVSTEVLLRIKVIEKILIKNGITTQDELTSELDNLFDLVLKDILLRANVKGDYDEMIKSLKDANKEI